MIIFCGGRLGDQIHPPKQGYIQIRINYLKSPFSLKIKRNKSTAPTALSLQKQYFLVRLQGLEPWTNRLRVYCSTN